MTTARKSVIYSALANFGSIATSLVLVIIVARWLFPAEVGAFAVAYAVITLLEPLRQAQIVAYVIQAEEYDRRAVSAISFVGWVTTAVVLAVSAVVVLLMMGPFDARLSGEMLLIMSGGFVASTIAQPAFALLNRELRFGLISVVEVASVMIKALVTIACLYAGFRAEALAFGILAEFLVKCVYVLTVERGYAFAWPNPARTKPVWNFCLKFTGAQFINRSSASADALLIGGFLGLAAAGFYNRSSVLVRTMRSGIEKAITPVALAVFAKSNRENGSQVQGDYLRAVSLLSGVSWSALAVFIAVAEPLILATYGERWAATIPLAQVLAAGGILHATTAMVPPLMASLGRVDILFRRNLMIQLPRLAILAAAVQFDLATVVWGAFFAMVLNLVINQSLLAREVEISPFETVMALWKSGVMALASALIAYVILLTPFVGSQGQIVQLVACLSGSALVWLTMLFAIGHPFRDELLAASGKVRAWVFGGS